MSLVKAENNTHRHAITRQRVRVIRDYEGQPTNARIVPPLPPWLLIEYHPLFPIYYHSPWPQTVQNSPPADGVACSNGAIY